MKNLINVLAVDDDAQYIAIQAEKAAYFGINLIHCPYWDQAYAMILAWPSDYDVIVLDGKGQINAQSESADINHLKKALKELNILEGKGIAIPYVVNTGYSDEAAIGFEVKVFLKGTGENQLYDHIQVLASNSLAYRMRSKFSDVVPAFAPELLGPAAAELFLHVFGCVEVGNSVDDTLHNAMRQLLEAFCKAAGKIGILDPRMAGQSGRISLTACDHYIRGERAYHPFKDHPTHIFHADPNPFPKRIASCFTFVLAHTNRGSHFMESEDFASSYLTKALFFAVAEILGWMVGYAGGHPDCRENQGTIWVEEVGYRSQANE